MSENIGRSRQGWTLLHFPTLLLSVLHFPLLHFQSASLNVEKVLIVAMGTTASCHELQRKPFECRDVHENKGIPTFWVPHTIFLWSHLLLVSPKSSHQHLGLQNVTVDRVTNLPRPTVAARPMFQVTEDSSSITKHAIATLELLIRLSKLELLCSKLQQCFLWYAENPPPRLDPRILSTQEVRKCASEKCTLRVPFY